MDGANMSAGNWVCVVDFYGELEMSRNECCSSTDPISYCSSVMEDMLHILSLQDVKISKLKKPPDHQEGEKFFLRVHASLEDLGIPEVTVVAVFWVSEICMYMHLKCMSTASV
jgi:hypothetical protein